MTFINPNILFFCLTAEVGEDREREREPEMDRERGRNDGRERDRRMQRREDAAPYSKNKRGGKDS